MVGDFAPPAMLGADREASSAPGPPAKWRRRPNPPLPEVARPARVSRASAGSGADASPGRQSRHHAQASGLAAPDAGEFDLRRRVQFAPGDEYPRGRRATPTARAAARIPCASTAISASRAAVRNDVVAATLTEMFYEIDRMRSTPVGEEELADARNYMSGVFSLGLATQDGLAGQLATSTLERLPEDYLETYRERILKLTAGGCARRGAEIFRFGQRANRDRRRPRADRSASRAVRHARGVRRARESDLSRHRLQPVGFTICSVDS